MRSVLCREPGNETDELSVIRYSTYGQLGQKGHDTQNRQSGKVNNVTTFTSSEPNKEL